MAVKQSDFDAMQRDFEALRRDYAIGQAILADTIDLVASLKKRVQQLETNEMRKASNVVDVRPHRYVGLMRDKEHPGAALGIGTRKSST